MGRKNNIEKKRKFIRELFLYYKPFLSKEKQIKLLLAWIKSLIGDEEYEMVAILKEELTNVEDNVDGDGMDVDKVVSIDLPDNHPLNKEKEVKIVEKTPKKTEKRLKWVDLWENPFGFTIIDVQFSIKKKTFKCILLNYGIQYE